MGFGQWGSGNGVRAMGYTGRKEVEGGGRGVGLLIKRS